MGKPPSFPNGSGKRSGKPDSGQSQALASLDFESVWFFRILCKHGNRHMPLICHSCQNVRAAACEDYVQQKSPQALIQSPLVHISHGPLLFLATSRAPASLPSPDPVNVNAIARAMKINDVSMKTACPLSKKTQAEVCSLEPNESQKEKPKTAKSKSYMFSSLPSSTVRCYAKSYKKRWDSAEGQHRSHHHQDSPSPTAPAGGMGLICPLPKVQNNRWK